VSVAENSTVTAPTYGPLDGGNETWVTGGVLSTCRVTVVEADKLRLLVATQVKSLPTVSMVALVVLQPEVVAIPAAESGSVTTQLRLTSVLFHPLAFGAGRMTGVTTGGPP